MITAHAICRWLERVDGYDLQPIHEAYLRQHGVAPYDGQLLGFGAFYFGLPGNKARAHMLTPCVRLAIRAGCCRVRVGSATLEIKGGAVTTVLHVRKPKAKLQTRVSRRPVPRFAIEAAE